jgi:protein-L-isoaspartate(D-aspartate) O-methyltransferase
MASRGRLCRWTSRALGLAGMSAGVLAALLLPGRAAASAQDEYAELRHHMVEEQIRARDVVDPQVLAAMEQVPRHMFVPEAERERAYGDQALPIGKGQTISQPYIVALMTSLLGVGRGSKVLEVGTGSGYHAAVVSRVAGQVYTMEIVPALAEQARQTLARLGYDNVHVRAGDGYQGWPEAAPFDAVLLTAAPPRVPLPLLQQLKPGGRMVVPVGEFWQDLLVLTKRADGLVETRKVLPVRFVPMTGEVQSRREEPPQPPTPPPPGKR